MQLERYRSLAQLVCHQGPCGPGQMVEFKGTHGLVFPQAAFKLYMEVSAQLTPKPRRQPLASLLTPSSAADSGQSGKICSNECICAACLQVRFELKGKKKNPSFRNLTNSLQVRSRFVPHVS